jgi:hypothetical protein
MDAIRKTSFKERRLATPVVGGDGECDGEVVKKRQWEFSS